MRKLILICIALIAFVATNASGTSYHKSDQLQTFTVQQPTSQISPVIMPAVESTAVVQKSDLIILYSRIETQKPGFEPVYCDPDYGLCGLNGSNNYNFIRSANAGIHNQTARHV